MPSGVISYVSHAYPGQTTDKEIIIASDILSQMQIGDNVMADKGFLINDLLPEGKYKYSILNVTFPKNT